MKLNLAAELNKGGHYYNMPQIKEQMAQAPRPLPLNMRRFPMDVYQPIPDREPKVTAHLRAMLQDTIEGKPKEADYAPFSLFPSVQVFKQEQTEGTKREVFF